MSFLPETRPSSSSFGDDLENDKPVSDPTKELDAGNWNALKDEVAQVAAVCPLAVVHVTNTGTPSIANVLGVAADKVSVTKNGDGDITVTFDATTGIAIKAALVTVAAASTFSSVSFTAGSNTARVYTYDDAVVASNCGFTLVVF